MAERRVALVRAVNVGGTGTLRMERLRAIAQALGWEDVATLGASGNLLYTARGGKPPADAARLADALGRALGRPPAVVVRTRADLEGLVGAAPFMEADPGIPAKWRFVGFLAAEGTGPLPPVPDDVPIAYAARLPREVCWTMAAPHLRAIDLPKRIERALGVPMTVRNWNVVERIAERLAAPSPSGPRRARPKA